MNKALLLCLCLAGCSTTLNEATFVDPEENLGEWMELPSAKAGYIFIDGDITPPMATYVVEKILALDQRDDVHRITLVINSFGGYAMAFRVIHNAIRMTRKPVDTVNIGNCYSAACAVFASATGKRYAFENAHFMVHEVSETSPKDLFQFESQSYQSVLRKAARFPSEWLPLTDKPRFFTATRALEFGLVDKVIKGMAEVGSGQQEGQEALTD